MPVPTPAQQRIIERMAAQRERLRARRARREQFLAMRKAEGGLGADAPLPLRVAVFAKQHPAALAALAGLALVLGPKRLVAWAGVVLPLLTRLR
ncbi:hypothetical protein B2J86_00350 [Acidovorax sp. SRB_14]|nr:MULTISPECIES: hypothetical protein [unclassified Acidovorax]NMM84644.1 hypothetical protein [Rhodococcus sp. SRB_17]NMM76570.1 hypothetical protein [Acidovorax sp. SRB_24]NMM78358.1 hypothetical protein [Acidovorax sp. SRB_24]NMM78391.1 hypothetical protein [Acidovorax sp. SRB_24]NMM79392.1 hypothetical protein [Acidovorax sp. SRB_14]